MYISLKKNTSGYFQNSDLQWPILQGPIGFLKSYNDSINNRIIRSEVIVKLAVPICAAYLLCFWFWTNFNSAVSFSGF